MNPTDGRLSDVSSLPVLSAPANSPPKELQFPRAWKEERHLAGLLTTLSMNTGPQLDKRPVEDTRRI